MKSTEELFTSNPHIALVLTTGEIINKTPCTFKPPNQPEFWENPELISLGKPTREADVAAIALFDGEEGPQFEWLKLTHPVKLDADHPVTFELGSLRFHRTPTVEQSTPRTFGFDR